MSRREPIPHRAHKHKNRMRGVWGWNYGFDGPSKWRALKYGVTAKFGPTAYQSSGFVPEVWAGRLIEKFYAQTVLNAILRTEDELPREEQPATLCQLELHWHRKGETDKAICISQNGEDEEKMWLPKSQCTWFLRKDQLTVDVTMPEWLAKKNGLL